MTCAQGHRRNTTPNAHGACVRCAQPVPPWELTDEFVRDFYASFGIKDATEEALVRLHAGAERYGWLDYLGDKDLVQEAREELIDALHYAIFITLRARQPGVDEEVAATRVEFAYRASRSLVEALRLFEAIRELER